MPHDDDVPALPQRLDQSFSGERLRGSRQDHQEQCKNSQESH
jgi:hypothetical protein